MKKMSRWLMLMLVVCLCLSMCACITEPEVDYDDYDIATPTLSPVTVPSIDWPDYNQTQDNNNATQSQRPTVVQNGSSINVPALPVLQHTVSALPQSTTTMTAATFKTFTGSITQKAEKDTFRYTPPRDGVYRFEMVDIVSGLTFELAVFNPLGERVQRLTNAGNNDGFAVLDMKGGQTYTIELHYYTGFGNYTIRVGEQTPTMNVSSYSVIKDSIAFRNQHNRYTFIPTLDGYYRLEFAGVQSDKSFYLYVYNALGETVRRQSNAGNNDGFAVELKAGAQYTIEVQYYTGIGDYQLKIGKQKATVNVTNYSDISDSIEYKNQRNYYTFVPQRKGQYYFQLSNVMSGTTMYLYVYNSLGEVVKRQSNVGNNDGFVVEDFEAGETYTIMVEQYTNLGNYTLKIGKQKETISVRSGVTVNDCIEYKGQYNVYSFTASGSQHTASISGMPSDVSVSIYVLNALGERVSYQYSVSNGNTLQIRNLTAGQTYTIQVRYYSGTGDYSLKIN